MKIIFSYRKFLPGSLKSKFPGKNDGFQRTLFWARCVQLILPIVASLFIFSADLIQHLHMADYFTKIMRYEIIRGNLREAMYQSQRIISNNGPFNHIRFYDHKGVEVINLNGSPGFKWYRLTLNKPIYFTEDKEALAGVLSYSYEWDNIAYLSAIFLAFSWVATSFFLHRQRKIFIKKLNRDVEDQRNKAVARTINSLAHDLQAPLNLIDLSLKEMPLDRSLEPMKFARQGLSRIQAMLQSLKHNDADSLVKLRQESLNLNYLRSLAEGLAKLHKKQLEFSDIEVISGQIDSIKFERCLQNLLVNAFEAAKELVIFRVKRERQGLFTFEILDDGEGVPRELNGRLFERGATMGKSGGTGLGLAYARNVVEGHGGSIEYQRCDGLSAFRVELELGTNEKLQEEKSINSGNNKPVFEIGIFLGIDDFRTAQLIKDRLLQNPVCRVYCEIDGAEACRIAYVNDFKQLEALPEGRRQIIFSGENDTIESICLKIESLIAQICAVQSVNDED